MDYPIIMEGVEKKSFYLLKVIMLTGLSIVSVAAFLSAAPSQKRGGQERPKLAFLQKQPESASRVSVQHGLIAAKQDLPGKFSWPDAYGACDKLEENGYNDWHLPSRDELNKLYVSKSLIGGFSDLRYWSSTEYNKNEAAAQRFLDGSQDIVSKKDSLSVRPVRSF
jgi:hypothetical protein